MAMPRPLFHVTPPTGWLNDPHGICWAEGRYHLFFQSAAGSSWAPDIAWGHAVAPDLVRWRHLPNALTPRPGEGCWSGAARTEAGRPTLYYTSVDTADPALGRIVVARPDDDLTVWTAAEQLVAGPPTELGAHSFRDPCLVRFGDSWRMVVGVGVPGGTALAVQYRPDGDGRWVYGGVLCARSASEHAGAWTGALWECPQLFPVGDDWVLAVSVWDNDRLHHVAAAVGSYDGSTFRPQRWTRLTHDSTGYAMTSFTDRDGRPCVMFWLREESDHVPGSRSWTGALSLPMAVSINADRSVRLWPHPDVDGLRRDESADGPAAGLDLEFPVGTEWTLEVSGTALRLVGGAEVAVERPSRSTQRLPVVGPTVRVVVDVGIVELFPGAGTAAYRFAEDAEGTVRLTGVAPRTYRLRV